MFHRFPDLVLDFFGSGGVPMASVMVYRPLMSEKPPTVRLQWLDSMKGISILWIAFFHAYQCLDFPWPLSEGYFAKYRALCAPASLAASARCVLEAMANGVVKVGFHAVAVFVLLSGFGLVYSLAKTGEPAGGWIGWYRSRLLRLFPMYWLAHVIYLVSPFQAQYEPVDYRFLLSFLGNRVYPIEMIFYYFNPALWYFGLLLQLYLVFPILFRLLQRLGPLRFLVVAAAATFGCRYALLCVWPVNGYYVQGAFFLPRLWEFALGMAVGLVFRRDGARAARWLFSPATLAAGSVVYTLGLYSYAEIWTYTFTDALTGTGMSIFLAHFARACERVPRLGDTFATVGAYSYGLYLIHQPYVLYLAPRLRDLSVPMPIFVGAVCTLIGALAVVSSAVERKMNHLSQRAFG
jgi:peptidoglycan/LPS O-acetylase OafA/YrhL